MKQEMTDQELVAVELFDTAPEHVVTLRMDDWDMVHMIQERLLAKGGEYFFNYCNFVATCWPPGKSPMSDLCTIAVHAGKMRASSSLLINGMAMVTFITPQQHVECAAKSLRFVADANKARS